MGKTAIYIIYFLVCFASLVIETLNTPSLFLLVRLEFHLN